MSIVFNGAMRRNTRGGESSTIICNVEETSVPVMSSPFPGMLFIDIKHVRVLEDCKLGAEDSATSTINWPSSPREPSVQTNSPSKTSTKIPRF